MNGSQLRLALGEEQIIIKPLSLAQIQLIYERVDWSLVADELDKAKRKTGSESPISMFKALALPYLTTIHSEIELLNLLKESSQYRVICGFRVRPPTRNTLWHFKAAPLADCGSHRNSIASEDPERKIWFYPILYHILIAIWSVANKMQIDLPYIHYGMIATQTNEEEQILRREVTLPDLSNTEFSVSRAVHARFPVQVIVSKDGQPYSSWTIRPPVWWKGPQHPNLKQQHAPRSPFQQYTALSAIILSDDGRILLGKRKGGYKSDYYALPSGRQRTDESLFGCLKREVFEEIGLDVFEARPVSESFNRDQDNIEQCWSIGGLVTGYKGRVQNKEPDRVLNWEWFSLSDLPRPLFRPSEIIIEDYRHNRFPHRDWKDIEHRLGEEVIAKPEAIPIEQIRLPI